MKTVPRFAVIADDITGACDSGIQFRKQGLKTTVMIITEKERVIVGDSDVFVFNTHSRSDSPSTAYAKVRSATKAIRKMKIRFIYKKMDSTLRGNVGQEIDAVMDEACVEFAVLAPAFPANHRVTVGGYQLVNQFPLSETEFAHDFVNPVSESHIPSLLQNQSKRQVGYVDLSTVMKGAESVRNEFKNQMDKGKQIVVVDATSSRQLAVIVEAAMSSGVRLFCGSAGLAKELSRILEVKPHEPALVISGSLSEVTKHQILRARDDLKCRVFVADVRKILKSDMTRVEEIKNLANKVQSSIKNGEDTIVTTMELEDFGAICKQRADAVSIRSKKLARLLSMALAEIVTHVLNRGGACGLVLTGGSTATDIFLAMGVTQLVVESEVAPGIPFSRLVGGEYDGMGVVTKAGAFGDENAITESIRFLKGVR